MGVFFFVLGGNAGGGGVTWISPAASNLWCFAAAVAVKQRRDRAIRRKLCKNIGFEEEI